MCRKIVHEELQCQSPEVLVRLLAECLNKVEIENDSPGSHQQEYRVLDMAAGNGIVGEGLERQLQNQVKNLVGSDIVPAARMATLRDRPGVYDEWVGGDLCE